MTSPASRSPSCAARTASCAAFSNVCRHRAARVLDGAGNCGKAMRCPYHGWTYGLDGTLLAVPEKTGFPRVRQGRERPLAAARAASPRGSCSRASSPIPSRSRTTWGPFDEWLAPYRPERLVSYQIEPPCSRSTGRTRSTTTSRATTSRSAIPACCGCSTTSATWSRPPTRTSRSPAARCATRPRKNRQERLYQRLMRPMPGLREPERRAVELRLRLPGDDVQPLPGPDRLLGQLPAGRAAHAHRLERVPPARDRGPPRPDRAPAEHAHQPPRPARGQRPHRARPGGARVEPLPRRA